LKLGRYDSLCVAWTWPREGSGVSVHPALCVPTDRRDGCGVRTIFPTSSAGNLTSYREYGRITDRPVGLSHQGHSCCARSLRPVNLENGYEFAYPSSHFREYHREGLSIRGAIGQDRKCCSPQELKLSARPVPYKIEKGEACDVAYGIPRAPIYCYGKEVM